jgi:ELWxxDGT repeat protein
MLPSWYIQDPARREERMRRVSAITAILLMCCTLLVPLPTQALPQRAANPPASLVKNINTTTRTLQSTTIPLPSAFTTAGNQVFFAGYDSNNGRELWVTDGTASGTRLVRDIAPGAADSLPANITNVAGSVFFTTSDGWLWKSDGTAAGTIQLLAPVPAPVGGVPTFDGQYPGNMVDLNGVLFFTAVYQGGRALWRSDGTPQGTTALKQFPFVSSDQGPRDLFVVNNTLFFTSYEDATGRELWKSDGTASGTQLVVDLRPTGDAFSSSDSPRFAARSNVLYFFARNASQTGLWRSDGTAAGTTFLREFTSITKPVVFANQIYFQASDMFAANPQDPPQPRVGLWSSDGTVNGTQLVATNPLAVPLTVVGNVLLLYGQTGMYGMANTTPTLLTTATLPFNLSLDQLVLTVFGGIAYFEAELSGERKLWRTDGTPQGTLPEQAILPAGSSSINMLTTAGGSLYFSTQDAQATKIWRSDGSAPGTTPLHTLSPIEAGIANPVCFHSVPGSFTPAPPALTAAGNVVFFVADDGVHGCELWASNGSLAQTRLVKDIWPAGDAAPVALQAFKGQLYFIATNGTQRSIWRSDGSAAGTVAVHVPEQGANLGAMVASTTTLYFIQSRQQQGQTEYTLWKSDGSSAGTTAITTVPSPWAAISGLTILDNQLYFITRNANVNRELWKSDGTAAGTQVVITFSGVQDILGLEPAQNRLFFLAGSSVSGYDFWVSDGTEAGTTILKQLGPPIFTGSSFISGQIKALGNNAFFTGWETATGYELWYSDGTVAGTRVVRDINTQPALFGGGTSHAFPNNMAVIGSKLLFTADDGIRGAELWQSDGTEAGTTLLMDIYPGYRASAIQGITLIGSQSVAFAASNGVAGMELWQSDGTTAGTVQIADIAAGAGSSNAQAVVINRSQLLFVADDNQIGLELYALGEQAALYDVYLPTLAR